MATTAMPPRESKDFADLRDRAAYVYATGTLPTHLRPRMTSLLSKITRLTRNKPAALDQRGGSLQMTKMALNQLELEKHPLVEKVREFVDMGFNIQVSRGLKTRRPFGKVFMYRRNRDRTIDQITVQMDGSVLDRW